MTIATAAVVAMALLHALTTAWRSSWTDDERMHLAWSERLLEDGTTERVSHYLYNSKTPIIVPNVLAQWAAEAAGADAAGQRFCARLPAIVWLAGLLLAAYLLGRRLFGAPAACLAVAALCLDPNMIAHGSLVTADIAFALGVLLVVWAGLAFARSPSVGTGARLGGAVALAVTAKLTALIVVPLAIAIPFALRTAGEPAGRHRRRSIAVGLGVATVAAWLAICASYGFIGVGGADAIAWESGAMSSLAGAVGPLFALFPADFLSGIDQVLADERTHQWNAVILATRYPDGVWFYFVLLWLVKTPLGLLAGVAAGGISLVRERRWLRERERVVPLVLAALALAYFSFAFRAQVGYRYVLFCLPLIYLTAAATWAPLLGSRRGRVGLAAFALFALVEQAPFAGNPLSFTNAFVWDKTTAYLVVADSNLDWGQNDQRAASWAQRNDAHLNPHHVLRGTNLIGGNYLAGVFSAWRLEWLTWNRPPDGQRFHTHFVFRISADEFSRFLDEERTADPEASAPCTPAAESVRALAPSQAVGIDLGADGVSLDLCVRVEEPTDISVRARARANVGLRHANGRCAAETLFADQQAWLRLRPGAYRLCLGGRGAVGVHVERGAAQLGRPRP